MTRTQNDELALARSTATPVATQVRVGFLEQEVRDLQEKVAYLEDALQRQIDEVFFAASRASLDSATTRVQTGTRQGEWMEARG
jgi:TolA-binding protein